MFVANKFSGKLPKITLTQQELELLVGVTSELRDYIDCLEKVRSVRYCWSSFVVMLKWSLFYFAYVCIFIPYIVLQYLSTMNNLSV